MTLKDPETIPGELNPDLAKYGAVVEEIRRERGTLLLFALVEREDLPGSWDVVLSASWLGESQLADLSYVVDKLKRYLTSNEMTQLARVVLLKPDDVWVRALLRLGYATGTHLVSTRIGEVEIREAYLLVVKP